MGSEDTSRASQYVKLQSYRAKIQPMDARNPTLPRMRVHPKGAYALLIVKVFMPSTHAWLVIGHYPCLALKQAIIPTNTCLISRQEEYEHA